MKQQTERWLISLNDFGNALDRLEEMIAIPLDTNSYVIDATIQRFEFSYELCWKTFKYLLAKEGKPEINSPRATFSEAYTMGWIHDEKLWLEMIFDRNLTTHTYRHETALEVYDGIKFFYPALRAAYEELRKRYETK